MLGSPRFCTSYPPYPGRGVVLRLCSHRIPSRAGLYTQIGIYWGMVIPLKNGDLYTKHKDSHSRMNDHNPPKECSGTGFFNLMPSLPLSTLPQARPRSGSTADTILDLHCLHRSLSPSVKVFPMQLVTWLGSQRTAACCCMIVSLKIELFPYNLIFIGLWGHGRCLAGD